MIHSTQLDSTHPYTYLHTNILLDFILVLSYQCFILSVMPSSTIHFTPDFIKACETLWRDGFTKGVNGEDNYPDFRSFFTGPKSKIKEEPSYEDLEKLPFNPEKCEARVEKFGYAIQCTRSPFGGGCLCKTHQNMLDKLPEGKDIRYGRFNQPRPDVTLDKGEPIKWGPKKGRSKSKSEDKPPKLKVGELRDYLSTRIPNENFKGLKKPELLKLYNIEKSKEDSMDSSASSEEDNIVSSQEKEPVEKKPIEESVEKGPVEDSVEKESSEEQVEKGSVEESEEKKSVEEQGSVEDSVEKESSEEQVEKEPVEESEEDDGKGTLVDQLPKYPSTKREYIALFKKLGIDADGIVGLRSYKLKYEEHLKSISEDTEDMSDADDLEEDHSDFAPVDFEGVEYLEDEETGKIYNMEYKNIGKWNESMNGIIWSDDKYKDEHDEKSS